MLISHLALWTLHLLHSSILFEHSVTLLCSYFYHLEFWLHKAFWLRKYNFSSANSDKQEFVPNKRGMHKIWTRYFLKKKEFYRSVYVCTCTTTVATQQCKDQQEAPSSLYSCAREYKSYKVDTQCVHSQTSNLKTFAIWQLEIIREKCWFERSAL